MYSPRELYERIQRIQRSNGITADAAIQRLVRELEEHAPDVWRESGDWFLRQVEQRHFMMQQRHGRARPASLISDYPSWVHDEEAANEVLTTTPGLPLPTLDDLSHVKSDAQSMDAEIVESESSTNERDDHHDAGIHKTPVVAPEVTPEVTNDEATAKLSLPPTNGLPSPVVHSEVTASVQVTPNLALPSPAAEPNESANQVLPSKPRVPTSIHPPRESERHKGPGAQADHAPGTPWMKRVEWDWSAPISLPGVDRKTLAALTKRDLLTAEQRIRRGAETELRRADVLRRIGDVLIAPDETIYAAWNRTKDPLFNMSVRALAASKNLLPAEQSA